MSPPDLTNGGEMPTFKARHCGVGQKIEHVWDPVGLKIVCDIKGTLTTDDPVLVQKLRDLGYEEGEPEKPEEEVKQRGRPRKGA